VKSLLFPLQRKCPKIFENLCGKKHLGHSHNTPDKCFLYYYSKCDLAGYGPSILRITNLPLNNTALPGKAPGNRILTLQVETQDSFTAGWSYLQDVVETIKLSQTLTPSVRITVTTGAHSNLFKILCI
jgi:hypothetical protein